MGSEERPTSDRIVSGDVAASVVERAIETSAVEAVETLAAARLNDVPEPEPDADRSFDETVSAVLDVLVTLHAERRDVGGVGDDLDAIQRSVADAVDGSTFEHVVDSLARPEVDGERRTVDYAALDVRHLGRLYERLLDSELRVDGGTGSETAETPTVSLVTASDDRKAKGAYYTPDSVVDYVVERTLDPLVEDVRDAVGGVDDAEDARTFTHRLLDLSVVDPAMGCGNFLVGVVDFLAIELRDAWDVASGVRRDLDWARRQVVRHCVYGVDNDPLAVDVTRATLRLHAGTGAPSLDRHLAVGNSLVGCDGTDLAALVSRSLAGLESSGESGSVDESDSLDLHDEHDRRRLRALADARITAVVDDADGEAVSAGADTVAGERGSYFHWPLAFPSVFEVDAGSDSEDFDAGSGFGGFDAVVGNPPWVATAGRGTVSASLDTSFRSYLECAFETTVGQFDLYVAFCERMMAVAPEGRVGVVVPDAVLTRESNEPIRRHLLDRTSLDYVVRLGTAFDGVESGVAVLVTGDSTGDVLCADVAGDVGAHRVLDPTGDSYTPIPQSVFAAQDAARFRIHLDETTRRIVAAIDDHPTLDRVVSLSRGEELGKRAAVLDGSTGSDDDCPDSPRGRRAVAPGGAIRRYGVDEGELRSIPTDRIAKPATNYRRPKLVFRQTSDSLVGTYDDQSLVTLKSAYNLRPRPELDDPEALLKHLLGVLNSRTFAFYHHVTHAVYRSVFPQLNQSTLAALPAGHTEPDSGLVAAVDDRLRLETERRGIETDLLATLGDYDDGPRLDALPGSRLVPGATTSVLCETAATRRKLRIGSVEVEEGGDALTLSVTARFKPDAEETADESVYTSEPDRWGYVETDPIPALEFDALGERRRALVRAFVPAVIERAGGFAGYRSNATQTISPLDRLGALTLPDPSAVADGLDDHRRRVERAARLDDLIAAAERRIDDRVYVLYDLTEDEVAVVERRIEDK